MPGNSDLFGRIEVYKIIMHNNKTFIPHCTSECSNIHTRLVIYIYTYIYIHIFIRKIQGNLKSISQPEISLETFGVIMRGINWKRRRHKDFEYLWGIEEIENRE